MANSTPSNSNQKLHGKVAIITGGASGIGEVTARLFVDHGAQAVVIADIQDEKGQKLVKFIGTDRCTYIHCDVTDELQVKALVDTTVRMYGQLDIIFSNAGVLSKSEQTVRHMNLSELDKLFAVNVRGTAASVKHAARAMVEGRVRGSIICTASIAGQMGGENCTDYSMSKHAVLGLVRSASRQLGAWGIRVNSVSPGPVATPMLLEQYGPAAYKMVEGMSCLEGALKARHVAEAVLFLACEDSGFVTGHDLVVDGAFKPLLNGLTHPLNKNEN